MIYENKLFFIPPLKKERGFFKPMTWVNSSSPSTAGNTGSKFNQQEAELIAQFVDEKWLGIREHYAKKANNGEIKYQPIGELIAIITPFRDQPKEIRNAFERRIKEGNSSLTLKDLDGITIDTVHKLQGAEKSIVIFSAVQTGADVGSPFYAEQAFLLNVAVSRAKESFIAFICADLFRTLAKQTPH